MRIESQLRVILVSQTAFVLTLFLYEKLMLKSAATFANVVVERILMEDV